MIEKGGASLKAFVPQLQTTFVKSLSDPSREVRIRGSKALGKLIQLNQRVDPLLSELSNLCIATESSAIKTSVVDAMIAVLSAGGDKATTASLEKVKAAATSSLIDDDEKIRSAAAKCLSIIARFFEPSQITDLLLDVMGSSSSGADLSISQTCGRVLGVSLVLHSAGSKADTMREEVFAAVKEAFRDSRINVKIAATA